MDKLLEKLFRSVVRVGNLTIMTSASYSFQVGDGTDKVLSVAFPDRAAELRLLGNPAHTFGEMYMGGDVILSGGDLYDFVELGLRKIFRLAGE
jgi:cyclopropane-fatty-acyl-phospholipid synthase